jgi:hypothetical protein
MINIVTMKHFIYKTTHKNGKYYIGRHSTTDIDDGYLGSGRWVSQIKDKTTLIREILEYADDFDQLVILEDRYLAEHHGKPDCMNMSNKGTGAATGEANPMKRADVKTKFQGENHWLNKNPERKEDFRKQQLEYIKAGTHIFIGDTNPNKDGRNAKLAYERGTHNSITNNPSTINAMNGTHHWQDGKSPNYQGKLNKKLVEEGTHNFLGPELNKKRVEAGTHNFVGSEANLKRLAEGRHPSQMKKTCEHCGKISSVGMYKRWHGDNCKKVNKND